ncbi:hypothetical protein ACFP2T_15080 [Plantactinospora solaniradicis]|uniref:Uncharacterized protein n=1 Tax=Plantactinospora solaniradicis TaxID=1723736 RepID=A0ABW1K9M7_9ACTN
MSRTVAMGLVLALIGGVAGCGGGSGNPEATGTASPGASAVADDFVSVGVARSGRPFQPLGIGSTTLPESSVLVGPHFAVQLYSFAVTNELSASQVRRLIVSGGPSDGPMVAGDGREFLLVHLSEKVSRTKVLRSDGVPATAAVLVDGKSRPLERGTNFGDGVLVVSVPTGAAAQLVVTDADRPQSIDLRTGKRGPDALPNFHPALTGGIELEDVVRINGVHPAGQGTRFEVAVSAVLLPYADDKGWAKSGHLWLDLTVSLTVAYDVKFTVNLAKSLTVRGPDGRKVPIPAGATIRPVVNEQLVSGLATAQWSARFEVPDRSRRFGVTYRTTGKALGKTGKPTGFQRRDLKNTGTLTIAGAAR